MHAGHLQGERVNQGDLVQAGEAPGDIVMPVRHVGDEHGTGIIRFHGSDLGNPFRRFPVRDARIADPGGDEHVRIGASGHVIVRRVAGDDAIGGWIVDRVAPFGEVADGEGQAIVERRVECVDERNLRDHAGEQVGPHVGDRPITRPPAESPLATIRPGEV